MSQNFNLKQHLPIIFWCWGKRAVEKRALSRAWAKIKYLVLTCVDFHYPNDIEELHLLIETFQKETYEEDKKADSDSEIDGDGCNIFRENKKFEKLIVMDEVSGLTDKSKDFANFLTVS